MHKVLTVGTFDLFHSGHITLLENCQKYSGIDGIIVVGLNTDRFVSTFKNPTIYSFQERIKILSSCRYVDRVIENDSQCLKSMLIYVKPDYLIVGSDWAPPRDYVKQIGTTELWLAEHGIKLVFIPRSEDSQSSSKIREAVIANG